MRKKNSMDQRDVMARKSKVLHPTNNPFIFCLSLEEYGDYIVEIAPLLMEKAEESGLDRIEVHTRFEICETCQGRGTHVNPSIDAHGISAEEFAEDPEFAESYFSGLYDVACYKCGGERVIPVPDESLNSKQVTELVHKLEEIALQLAHQYAIEVSRGY